MKKSLIIGMITIMLISMGISTSYAQRLLKKLYDDKETVRGGAKVVTKKVQVGSDKEEEYYYKDTSGIFPKSGCAYLQYYHYPNKATIIVNNKVTADVLLYGIDPCKYDYTNDFYYEVYDRFMINKAKLTYKVVGKCNGMWQVVLYSCCAKRKVNINKWINKYCRIEFCDDLGYERGPVWKHRGPYNRTDFCSCIRNWGKWVEARWQYTCKPNKVPSAKIKISKCRPCQGV